MADATKVTVYGTEKANMVTGKAYQVSSVLAEKLIKKGRASKNPIKEGGK